MNQEMQVDSELKGSPREPQQEYSPVNIMTLGPDLYNCKRKNSVLL